MPKSIQEILDNLDFDFNFDFDFEIEIEIPDFPSGSEEEFWHKSEAEIELDGHVW